MPEAARDARVLLERLRMTRVAKDLFLSEWYQDSCDALRFSPDDCALLGRIAEETRGERESLTEVVEDWARRLAREADEDEKARDVARVARRDFLLSLIDAKDAAGDALERAALLAPGELRAPLNALAEVDHRHANELRALLVAEVRDAWSTRHGRVG